MVCQPTNSRPGPGRWIAEAVSVVSLCLLAPAVNAEAGPVQPPRVITLSPTTFVYPVLGPRLSSDYGVRKHPLLKATRHHHGVDLAAPVGAAVRAIAGGQVIYADPYGGYGNFIVIRHANEFTSHYGHCDAILVNPGQSVRPGQIIAKVGSSGISTGPHLHLEIRQRGQPEDPERLLPGLADPAVR